MAICMWRRLFTEELSRILKGRPQFKEHKNVSSGEFVFKYAKYAKQAFFSQETFHFRMNGASNKRKTSPFHGEKHFTKVQKHMFIFLVQHEKHTLQK